MKIKNSLGVIATVILVTLFFIARSHHHAGHSSAWNQGYFSSDSSMYQCRITSSNMVVANIFSLDQADDYDAGCKARLSGAQS